MKAHLVAFVIVLLLLLGVSTLMLNIPPTKSDSSVLFFDDFNNGNADGWTSYCEQNGYWNVVNGEYFVSVGNVENGISTVNGLNLTDCVIEARLEFKDTQVGFRAGIVFRYTDYEHYYAFEISNEHDCMDLVKYSPANPEYGSVLAGTVEGSNPIGSNIEYCLKVDIQGNTFTCFLDGDQVFSFRSDSYGCGQVGLRARRADAFFDDFKVVGATPTPHLERLTDRSIYGRGQLVNIAGIMTGADGPVSTSTVALEVNDSASNTIFSDMINTDTSGSFADSFTIPLRAALGTCTLIATSDTTGYPLAQDETTFTVGSAPRYGGTLRIGSNWILNHEGTFNPLENSAAIYYPFWNFLVRPDENGTMVPDLAKSWNCSEDGLNYTFKLYDNVTWHDGVRFNASDVQFTFDTILNNPDVDQVWYSCFKPPYFNITSINIDDEFTITFLLDEPRPSFISYLNYAPIIPRHIYGGTNITTNPYNLNPVGAGPFKMENLTPWESMTLVANENYFRGRPPLDKIIYLWNVDEPVALLNNQIDLAGGLYENVDPAFLAELNQVSGITTVSYVDDGFYYMGFNLRNPILQNLKIRQAIAYCINYSRLSEIYMGYFQQGTGPISPSYSYWYNPNVTTYYYNQTLSEELLDEAGYPRNSAGVRFNITMLGPDYDYYRGLCSEAVRDCMQHLGVNVTLQLLPKDQFYSFFDTHDFDIVAEAGWGNSGVDPTHPGMYFLYHSDSYYNAWGYNNSEVDRLLEEGATTLNQTLRKEIYDRVQVILADELPNLFLGYRVRSIAYHNDFHGFVSNVYVYPTDDYSLERVWYEPALSVTAKCPVNVCVIDSEGRRTGYDPSTGQAVTEIPSSSYSGVGTEPQMIKVRSPTGNYSVILTGTGAGEYTLEVVSISLDYKYTDITSGTAQTYATQQYDVQAMADGTITVEQQVTAGSRGGGRPAYVC